MECFSKTFASTVLLTLVLVSTAPKSNPRFFREQIEKCNVHDRQSLDHCLVQMSEAMKPHLKKGIREWQIPPMDPMRIESLAISQGVDEDDDVGTRVRGLLTNLQMDGMSNYEVIHARSVPQEFRYSLNLRYPEIKVKGDYELNGTLLYVPVSGSGPFWATFYDVTTEVQNQLKRTGSSGRQLVVDNIQTEFAVGNMKLNMENLFSGDAFLGDTMNTFLNDNSERLIQELQPGLMKEVNNVVVQLLEQLLAAIPYSIWMAAVNHLH